MKRWPLEVRIAAGGTALVVIAAWALSYDALAAIARAAGYDWWFSWAYPVVVDGVLGVGLVAAVVLRTARIQTRAYVWALIGAATAVSVAGNAAHGEQLPAFAAAAARAVPPCSLAAALHLLIIVVRGAGARSSARSSARPQRTPARGRTAARVRVLEDQGLDTAAIARRVGRSPSQVRRVRSALRSEVAT